MRLADFIETKADSILERWDQFARTLLPNVDGPTLRDHGREILAAIAKDLRASQSREEQDRKARGLASDPLGETAAQTHAVMRASKGLSIRQLVSEYRALRASVLRQWLDEAELGADTVEDMTRFNEALDQAVSESVDSFTTTVERWRNIFLGALGHDLRTPLSSILLTAKLISNQSPPPHIQHHVDRLVRGGERMGELLDDLLDFNRVSLGGRLIIAPKWTDLCDVAADEMRLLQAAHEGTQLNLSTTGSCKGMWDAARLRQALANLVDNAVKYGDGLEVAVSLRGKDDAVELSVTNQGSHIPETDRDAIFDPLIRGSDRSHDDGGAHMGLGLFIVRQAVEAHGGSIVVESGHGRTTFTAHLPKRS